MARNKIKIVTLCAIQLEAHRDPFWCAFSENVDFVIRTLERLGVFEGDVEDEAHDLFLTIHGHFDEYDASRPLRPWLLAFAVRHASNYRHRSHRRRTVPSGDVEPEVASKATSTTPEDDLEDRERQRYVLEAIRQIENYDQRALFIMHELDGVAIPEIATLLGISENTAYSRLRLARKQFRAVILAGSAVAHEFTKAETR